MDTGGLFIGNGPLYTGIVGASATMARAMRIVEKAAASPAPVLIGGETGTGKELVAQAIHDRSSRRRGRFVAVNCGALPEALLESELFGHARGAFTGAVREHKGLFEEAHGGTLFLDEIGDMPAAMQIKLLRVLEESAVRRVGSNEPVRVDVRILSATHKELRAEIEAGRFRRDLSYRLDVLRVHLPPLRDRAGDVALLARYFFDQFNAESGQGLKGLSAGALQALTSYTFPGNVRELRNEIERAVALANPGEYVDAHLLSPELRKQQSWAQLGGRHDTLPGRLRIVERQLILEELRRHDGNRTRSAANLGISLRALQKKIVRLEIKDL